MTAVLVVRKDVHFLISEYLYGHAPFAAISNAVCEPAAVIYFWSQKNLIQEIPTVNIQ